jgi:pyrroloquinoline quinone biosynthesis protein E
MMPTISAEDRPALRRGVRLVHDPVRGRDALLYPEGVLLLNDTAAAVVEYCDGERTLGTVVAMLGHRYADVPAGDVVALLEDLVHRRLVDPAGAVRGTVLSLSARHSKPAQPRSPTPMGMLAELTYRCPLHCGYCSNPVGLAAYGDELPTDVWRRVVDEARDLGVLQVHFSGGEPLLRRDLPELIAHAHNRGMYTNLVTSGIPLKESQLAMLVAAGLDHLQLSIQDSDAAVADAIAGASVHARKVAAAASVVATGLAFTVNVVLHRGNLDRVAAIADTAVALGAERVELAHTQFYGWGLRNQAALMPTDEQIAVATRAVAEARRLHGDRVEIVYVEADYHSGRPKPCMNGWGSRQFVVAPNGDVLPCLAAAQLPFSSVPNVRVDHVATAWYDSDLFNRFRGTNWLPEPCQSCALRDVDFGGCRCQAFQLIGDPAATDPACDLSPDHRLVQDRRAPTVPPQILLRRLR